MIHRSDQLPDELAPPDVPVELRHRVLGAAREAMTRIGSPDIWTRIWGSRSAHLAWAASVAVLIFGHLLIGRTVPAGSPDPALPLAAAAGADTELAELVDFQRVTVVLPGWVIAARGGVTQPDQTTESEDHS